MQAVSKREGITFNLSRVALLPSVVIEAFEDLDRHFEGLRQSLYLPVTPGLTMPTPISASTAPFGVQEYALKLLSCVIGNSAASLTHATAATDSVARELLLPQLQTVLRENPTARILITPVYAYPVKGFASVLKQRYYLYWTGVRHG